jgi:hypothetical protein
VSNPRIGEVKPVLVVEQIVPPPEKGKPEMHKDRELKSITLEVNRGAVQRAETIQKKSPELAEKVAAGEMTASAALLHSGDGSM